MLITNATLITHEEPNRVLPDHALFIENGKIADLGPQSDLLSAYPGVPRLDARAQWVMPGNVCAHTHFYGAFARGLAIPGAAPKDFPEILQRLWWLLDQSLDEEAVRLSAQVMLADAIRHGTTTLIDHHASPNALRGSLANIARAVEQAGVRAVLCYEVTDRYGAESTAASIRENLQFATAVREGNFSPRLAAAFGMHASLSLSTETLDHCRELAPEDTAFHIHVAEHESDEYDSLARSGTRVVDRLYRHNLLNARTIVAHAVHIDAHEAVLLAETGAWVTHQPRSNMNNAVGAAQVESLLRLGIPVCIGTDGFSHTMWQEWKTAYLLHKHEHRDPRRMNGADVFQMGVHNNVALANTFFPKTPVGKLIPGYAADLIFVDYHPFTPLTPDNLPWHILFGFDESMITTTIAAGQVLMRDRELLTLDESAIAARAREIAPQIWQRYAQYAAA
ncbi:MAG: putative aminohydrolase SsnA [Anaerolineales bacterium]